MDKETQQKIQERFNSLPKDIQEAMSSVDIGEKIASIGKNNELHLDQTDKLYLEISLAMLGIEPLSDFTKNVMENVGIDEIKAQKIAGEVNEEIFQKIRDTLKQIQPEETTSNGIAEENKSNRDRVLNEIENPVPTKPTTSIMESPEKELVNKVVTDDFIAKKMSPKDASYPNTETAPAPKKYSVDPYREPLN